ncbi:hypothetical protein DI383_02235 [Flavobacteriaceae bacterium LYZ1037]|nr:hypothetical protein DI383_02235 [Flavobacteriaceae bacterium LYZ1037]
MALQKTIKVRQVFQSYPIFYQPYIPPVMDALWQHPELDFGIQIFVEGEGPYVNKMPSYYYRRIFEKLLQKFNKKPYPLNYLEWKAIKQDVDVVHIQDSYLFKKIYGLLHLDAKKRPKVVITLRGNDTYVKPWIQKKWQDFYKIYGNKVDAFIVMSIHQKNYLHTNWGISLDRIHVIPISYGNKHAHQPKTLNSETIKIVSAFRMCWEKNIDGNLRTIAHLKSLGAKIKYDLYGDGPDAGQVSYLINKYDLQYEVCYHGRIENKELKKRLIDYDFFLQLSHSDALPTSVLEAQSYGLPAIVANSGGLPESIVPYKSGYVVEAYDTKQAAKAILDLWNDSKKYENFSQQAIAHSQTNFTISNEVNRLLMLYRSLSE